MFEPNVERVLSSLKPEDLVLDVGGWACPFNRANWVVDAQPYETRGFYRTFGGKPFQGPEQESFTRDTWVVRDICDKAPFPFADKQFDFAICSHTLEDIRDPLWVCRELMRVAKRGYIEVPSRIQETCRGWECPNMAGLSHHRWLIDIGDNRIQFLHKLHLIHTHWRFSFPAAYHRQLEPERAVQFLWWEGSFEVEETLLNGPEAMVGELERYVASVRPYPAWRLAVDRQWRWVLATAERVRSKLRRVMSGAQSATGAPK